MGNEVRLTVSSANNDKRWRSLWKWLLAPPGDKSMPAEGEVELNGSAEKEREDKECEEDED